MKMMEQREEDILPSNIKRKKAYQHMSKKIHGTLGLGNRIQLPTCVTENIKRIYPDENGIYMGYKDA